MSIPSELGHVAVPINFLPKRKNQAKLRNRDLWSQQSTALCRFTSVARLRYEDYESKKYETSRLYTAGISDISYNSKYFRRTPRKSLVPQVRPGMGAYAGAERRHVHLATVLLRPPSGHRPGRRQARQARILWTPPDATMKLVDAPSAWSSLSDHWFLVGSFRIMN